jgi:hypothetical protein
MMTLDEARDWYLTARSHLGLFGRFGKKYWDGLPWDGPLGKDDTFKEVESDRIVEGAVFCLDHLDDFAVLILFSVFESIVRDRVLSDISEERSRLTHALLIKLVDDSIQDVESGSFFRVLEVFKSAKTPDLVEEVNQVRKYRNWVAHGRRTDRPEAVDPETAFSRLKRFLELIDSEHNPAIIPRESSG